MKASEIIAKYRKEIAESMTDAYRSVISHAGRFQYKIYIWSDGEIERLAGVQGDYIYLIPKSTESRSLYYIATVSAVPDDKSEKEAKEKDIIDCLVSDYRNNSVNDIIDNAIEYAKADEEYNDMYDATFKK